MLNKLILRNFQKHKKLIVPLGQITTIVGRTDAGKSAIIRALRWITLNQPRGDAFVRDGAKECSVSLFVDEHKIKRIKGEANTYQLDDQKYQGFGTKVPDTIADLLNIGPINFQQQHDSSFWLSLSSAEVGRQLNAVINMDLMDKMMSRVSKDEREAQSRYKYEQERLVDLEKNLKELEWVPDARKAFKRIESRQNAAHETRQQIARLHFLLERGTKSHGHKQNAETALSDANGIAEKAAALVSMRQGVVRLSNLLQVNEDTKIDELLQEYKRLKKEAKKCQQLCQQEEHTERISTRQTSNMICPKCGTIVARN